MRKTILLLFVGINFSINLFSQTDYNMNDSTVVANSGYFYDSGGSGTTNFGFFTCIIHETYSNNEHYIKTFNSANGLNFKFDFNFIELKGSDVLKVYDGSSTASTLIKVFTSADTMCTVFSSGTSITFEFTSFDNGLVSGCENGGNWESSFEAIQIYQINDTSQVQTCSTIISDDGGLYANYSPNVSYEKTICSASDSCLKMEFNELNIASGDFLYVYKGISSLVSPIAQFTDGDQPIVLVSEEELCLTVKFVSDATMQSSGWIASISCTDNCIAIPPCISNPAADNQCINATPICNHQGYCGNTSATYTNIDHLGNDWNNVIGLMDDYCGSIENNSWLSFIAEKSTATLNVWTLNCLNNSGIQVQIFSTDDCQDFQPHSACSSVGIPTDYLLYATNLNPGQTYYIMIDGYAGDVCDYVISVDYGIMTDAIISQDQYICPGQTVNISVVGTDSTTIFNWSSNPVDTTMQIFGNMIIANPSVTTQYSVNVAGQFLNPDCGSVNTSLFSNVTVLNSDDSQCTMQYICNIAVSSSESIVCPGEEITLSVDSSLFMILMDNDFNDNTVGAGWSSTAQATFTNPCNQNPANDTYLWMGDISPAPRQLTSEDFNVINGGFIRFDLRYSIQADMSPCEGPDEIDEGVTLQYSTDYGVAWNPIVYFNPSGVIEPNGNIYLGQSIVVANGTTSFTDWAQYELSIPTAAKTEHTRFRWIQEVSTDFGYDHWGIDNIRIIAASPNPEVYWTSVPSGFSFTGGIPPSQFPNVSTYFIAELTDGQYSCYDSVLVTAENKNFVNGTVSYSNGNLQTGVAEVKLYDADLSGFNIVGLSDIESDGSFLFDSLENGNCFLKVDLFNNSMYPDLHNTYYDSTYQWNQATILYLTGCDSLNLPVKMYEISSNGNGNGIVSGNINNNTNAKSTMNVVVVGADITLELASTGEPIQNRVSDLSGTYVFENLAFGEYRVVVDIPNIPQFSTHYINVNSIDSVLNNINFFVDTITDFGIFADTILLSTNKIESNQLIIWPNPVQNQLYVEVSNQETNSFTVEIINSLGSTCVMKDFNEKNNSKSSLKLNTKTLSNGIYFIKVTIGNSIYLKKFVKE